jgi:Domain of unknown function (DUF4124)
MAVGLFALLTGGTSVQAAVVYKWTDADGVIHFSDQPVPGAEKIVTASGASHNGWVAATPNGASAAAAAKPKSAALDFKQLAIVSPGKEETITGMQAVNVRLAIDPGLKPTQSIAWFLNGSPLASQPPDAVQFTLDDLARGTYTISATVMDQPSGQSTSVDPVTFYVVRPSLLSPQHKNP